MQQAISATKDATIFRTEAELSMVTIHQELLGSIKTEPEWDPDFETESQISAILGDKSNPIGLTDDIRIVKEVRAVGIELEEAPTAGL